MSEQQQTWQGAPQRVDRALQELGLARSRTAAQKAIAAGQVSVNRVVVTKTGAQVRPGQRVAITGTDHYVSRGAHKLIGALDTFGIPVEGRVALDVGASTGGFTQVLLERGIDTVLAIDVGHGQLDPSLLGHERVRLFEGCNARYLTPETLAEGTGDERAPDLIVGDLSFISLTQVLPALTAVQARSADIMMLIKPQFEVGREGIGDGVVTDPKLQHAAVQRVLESALGLGLSVVGLTESPIVGSHGNREFLVHLRAQPAAQMSVINEMMAQVVLGEGSARE